MQTIKSNDTTKLVWQSAIGPMIDDGTIRTLSATDPVDEKYCEVWQRMGGELRCFVLNQQTGELMGSCPKEQYP